jgi:hypothetical protein
MTEQGGEQAQEVPPELEIVFKLENASGGPVHERAMWVKMPTPEKILVWQRTVDRLTKVAPDASWTGSEVMAALERLRKIIDSLLVNQTDVVWIDDQFLEGTLNFRTLAPFVNQAALAFQQVIAESGNRETRRAAKKAVKRKAP